MGILASIGGHIRVLTTTLKRRDALQATLARALTWVRCFRFLGLATEWRMLLIVVIIVKVLLLTFLLQREPINLIVFIIVASIVIIIILT